MFTDLAQIFNFTLNPFALVSLGAALVNFSLVVLIHIKAERNESNRWFRLLLAAIVLWGVSEFLARSSGTAEGNLFWGFTGRPGWIFVPVLLFSFTLSYIGKDLLKNRLYQYLVFGPPLVFLFVSWNTNLISNNSLADTFRVPWGWDTVPVAPYFWVFIFWLEAFLISSVAMLTRYYFKTNDKVRKKQTLLIIIAVLIPIIGGSITDAILPIFGVQILPVAVLLTSVMSVVVTYAILRFVLFVINPILTAKTIIDTMSESLIVLGPRNTIEQINKSTSDLLGYRKDELLGKSIRRILPDVKSWDTFLKRVIIPLKENTFVRGFEIDFRTNVGTLIPVSFSAKSLVQNGHLIGMVGLARDIRDTRKLINRLTAERDKISVTINGIVDGVFAVNKSGHIIIFNPAMERMLKVGQDDVINRFSDEVIHMYDNEKKLSIMDMLPKHEVFEDQVITSKKNIQISGKDGREIYVDLTSSTIAGNEEVNLGAIITLHDVSKEHDLEEMKLDFVSMAAHELRTPLTSIRGYLSVLQEELVGKVDKEKMDFLQKAFISSGQLASLVENLLSVSRIERGKMKIETSPVDLLELLTEVVSTHEDQAKQKKIKLELIKPDEKLPKIRIDRFRISEMVSNLVGNALSYTDVGGSVIVSVTKKDNDIITEVADTGQGIPEEALPKLFTKFFRVSGVLEQGSKGTGLGLYISKAIVEMHKGRIWVKSTLGKGSTFSFSLPLGRPEKIVGNEKKGSSKETIKKTFVKKGKKMPQLV